MFILNKRQIQHHAYISRHSKASWNFHAMSVVYSIL